MSKSMMLALVAAGIALYYWKQPAALSNFLRKAGVGRRAARAAASGVS